MMKQCSVCGDLWPEVFFRKNSANRGKPTLHSACIGCELTERTNKKQRNRADVRRAIKSLLEDEEWIGRADGWIADVVKCDTKTVQAMRERLEEIMEIPRSRVLVDRYGRQYERWPEEPEPQPTLFDEPEEESELLKTIPKNTGAQGIGVPFHDGSTPKLADIGIDRKQSHRAQRLADIPHPRDLVATGKTCKAPDHRDRGLV